MYNQVPSDNTFVDTAKFAGPKELAEYIKQVNDNKSLYKSYFNFDINQMLNFQKNYPNEPLGCAMCKHLYHLRINVNSFITLAGTSFYRNKTN